MGDWKKRVAELLEVARAEDTPSLQKLGIHIAQLEQELEVEKERANGWRVLTEAQKLLLEGRGDTVPTLDSVLEALHAVDDPELYDALTYTKWKDGIDIQVLTQSAMVFAKCLLAAHNEQQQAAR